MKYSPEYSEIIKEIGSDPFFVLFWTPTQIEEICLKCSKNVKTTLELNDMVFFVSNQDICWNNIPRKDIFQGKQYLLSAIIERIPENHYAAHILRPNRKWYTFDSSENAIKPSNLKTKKINVQFLSFVIPTILHVSSFDDYEIVLQNFHTTNVDGINYTVNYSCAPDSILQALACKFIDTPNVFQNTPNGDILKFLSAFAEKEIDLVYALRVRLLENYCENKKKYKTEVQINCYNNVKNTLTALFSENFPSVTLWCDCGGSRHALSTVDVDFQLLTVTGFRSIHECLIFPRRVCDACELQISNKSIGNVIFIDVEPTSIISMPKTNLNEIAQNILFEVV